MCNVADDECAVDAAREQLTVAGEVELADAGAEVANERGLGVLVMEDAGGLECAQVPDFHVALARARRQRVLVRIECDRLDGRVVRAQLLDLAVRAYVVNVHLALAIATIGEVIERREGRTRSARHVSFFVAFCLFVYFFVRIYILLFFLYYLCACARVLLLMSDLCGGRSVSHMEMMYASLEAPMVSRMLDDSTNKKSWMTLWQRSVR